MREQSTETFVQRLLLHNLFVTQLVVIHIVVCSCGILEAEC